MNLVKKTKGFTLIELLVVITIIAILAGVVMSAVTRVRDKGVDAAVKSTLNNTRSQAQIHYSDNGNTYTTLCTAGTSNIAALLAGATIISPSVRCADSPDAWAAEAQLKTSTSFYCVDSTGAAVMATSTSIADGSDYVCGP